MTRFLLDTSTISQAMNWDDLDPNVFAKLKTHGSECAISAQTWYELNQGVQLLPHGKRREVLDAFLHQVVRPTLPILAYDQRAAEWHAVQRSKLEKGERQVGLVVGQIAAIAATNGLTIVTVNPRDYGTFPGLNVVSWASAAPTATKRLTDPPSQE